MSEVKPAAGYSPELKALMVRLSLYVKLRWLVVCGIIVVTVFARQLFDIDFPVLPVYIICAVILAYNFWMYLWTRSLAGNEPEIALRRAGACGYVQVVLDLIVLTVLLHYSGGITNPFIFSYLIHTTVASILVSKRRAYELTAIAVGLAALLAFMEYSGVISHVNLQGFIPTASYQQFSMVSGVIGALVLLAGSSTYISVKVAGELRAQQHKVDKLREQLIEKNELELQTITGEVVRLKEEKTNFIKLLSVVAHDLQAPLAAVQSCISYVVEGYAGNIVPEQKEWLQRGSRRIDGMLALVTDLIDIPRIELGGLSREMTELDFNEVVRNSLEGQDILAQQKGLEFHVVLPDKPPRVFGSSRRLQQVITNLANNAVKYTSKGSVRINVFEDEKDVRTEFMDTGIGIPAKDLPRLFDEFYRASNVENKGVGLGLSISRRIIAAHGGKIQVESPCPETGLGSKFTVTIPKIQSPPEEKITGGIKMSKILVIDDDADLVAVSRGVLEREGYKVVTASNGRDGLGLARKEKPDLILLDIMMPVMDGYAFADEFNNDASIAKIPLIALTATRESPLGQPVQFNVKEYVIKPIVPKDLIVLVNKYLKK